jgi:hypothetical protein
MLAAAKQGAVGEVMSDSAVDQISKAISDIEVIPPHQTASFFQYLYLYSHHNRHFLCSLQQVSCWKERMGHKTKQHKNKRKCSMLPRL